jgi:hypothetical protein
MYFWKSEINSNNTLKIPINKAQKKETYPRF